jgi:tRNA-intron lyase
MFEESNVKVKINVVYTQSGPEFLVWDPLDCRKLRETYGLAVSPIGSCPLKISTNGKVGAVPVSLCDEEVFVCTQLSIADFYDRKTKSILSYESVLSQSEESSANLTSLRLNRIAYLALVSKGYKLTNGIKFGVTYLAYRADPSLVHAPFMVLVLEAGSGISPIDLITKSRVSTGAKKIVVLCWVDLNSQVVVKYDVFKRMGPGATIYKQESLEGNLSSRKLETLF